MKITAIDTAILRVPTRKPMALEFPQHSLVVAHVRTDEGVTGLGYSLAFGGGGAESIQAYLVTRLAPLLIGEDPLFVERLWERMYRADRGIKRQGVAAYALDRARHRAVGHRRQGGRPAALQAVGRGDRSRRGLRQRRLGQLRGRGPDRRGPALRRAAAAATTR